MSRFESLEPVHMVPSMVEGTSQMQLTSGSCDGQVMLDHAGGPEAITGSLSEEGRWTEQ